MKQIAVTAIAALGGSLVGGVVVASSSAGPTASRSSSYFGEPVVAGVTRSQVFNHSFGDIDNDGLPDLIYNDGITNDTVFMKNDGFGNFVEEEVLPGLASDGFFSSSIADINGNGVNEVVGVSGGLTNGAVLVLPNLLAPWQPSPARAADLNGDQMVDGGDLGILLGLWGPVAP